MKPHQTPPRWLRAFLVGSVLAAGNTLTGQTYTAAHIPSGSDIYRQSPYQFTGLIFAAPSDAGRVLGIESRSGSGAVVRHPRVVFSCAHVVFEKDQVDPWLGSARWYRAHSEGGAPSAFAGQALRGYQFFSGYTAPALRQGNSNQSFSLDFVVHYAFENTANGGFAAYWDDGVAALKSNREKLITGYPAGNYPDFHSRRYLMHRTGPFTREFTTTLGDYLEIDEVSTGAGNSGGPIWVLNGTVLAFAGVLVSGLERSTGDSNDQAGVYGVDSSSSSLIDAAIRSAGGTVAASAPVITTNIASRRVDAGENVTFTVAATGSGLQYRWLFNNAVLPGATGATLTLSGVTLAQAGTYQAIVSNSGGEVRSNSALLDVAIPLPTIVAEPQSRTAAVGANVSFFVTAVGQGTLTYQWSFTNSAGQSSVLAGASAASLALTNVQAANAGSYAVTVRSQAGGSVTSRPATLTVSAPGGGGSGGTPGASNDAFASAVVLAGTSVRVEGSNVGASREAGEPVTPFSSGGASVWWVWTARDTGQVSITTAGSSFDTMLAVYTGSSVGSLVRIAADDDSGLGATSQVTFNGVAGTSYRIMVDGFNGSSGSIVLSLNQVVPAGGGNNDQFANRIAFPAAGGSLTSSNASATRETSEPNHAGRTPVRSVWFTWAAATSGSVTIRTAGSNFDTVLAVYTGTALGSLAAVAANDDAAAGIGTSQVVFNAVSGSSYHIAVDGYNGASGNIAIALVAPTATVAPTVPNDFFSRPSPIGTGGGAFNVSSLGATKEPGEPLHANHQGGASLWWTWTAPSAGTVSINTRGSNFDTVLAVYTGNALASLVMMASNDDAPDGTYSALTFNAQSGQTYRIAVDGDDGWSGNVRLSLAFSAGSGGGTAGPANDLFSNNTFIAPAGGTVTGGNVGASRESGEPNHSGAATGRSVWWRWTPATATTCTISTAGSDFDTLLAVYVGSAVNRLASVASNDNQSSGVTTSLVQFTAAANITYTIAVDGKNGASGSIRLSVTTAAGGPAAPANNAFASRALVPPAGGAVEGTNAGATRESGEPAHAGREATRSVWWTWTPNRGGVGTVKTAGSSFDTVLAVYRGTAMTALTPVASNDDSGGANTSSVTFAITAGTAYLIAVDGFQGASGSVRLSATIAATPETAGITQNTRLANLSVRSPAGSGGNTLVVGFALAGGSPKPILVRAIGPALGTFGVSGPMPDPVLRIFREATVIEENDQWGTSARADGIEDQASLVGAFPLNRSSRDAAILINLLPGSYTAQISAAGTSANGVALLEVYDSDFNADADAFRRKLINISSRAQVGTEDNAMFAGFFVLGPTSKRVLIRGIGPSLSAFGVTGALSNAQVTVRRGTSIVAANDDWSGAEIAAAANATGAFPLAVGSRDAALVTDLIPGSYTVELAGVGNAVGVGLIEVYEVP